jgi:hypothetical protein
MHYVLRSTKLLILFGIRKNFPDQWKESIIAPFHKKDKTDCSNYRGLIEE